MRTIETGDIKKEQEIDGVALGDLRRNISGRLVGFGKKEETPVARSSAESKEYVSSDKAEGIKEEIKALEAQVDALANMGDEEGLHKTYNELEIRRGALEDLDKTPDELIEKAQGIEASERHERAIEEKKKIEIAKAGDFGELYVAVRKIGEIKSVNGQLAFSPDEMVEQIEAIREKTKDMSKEAFEEEVEKNEFLKLATRNYGIRDKVVELIRKEKNPSAEELEKRNQAERMEKIQLLKKELKKLDDDLTAAEKAYLDKKNMNESVVKKFKSLFIKTGSLRESESEEIAMKSELEKITSEYAEKLKEIKTLEKEAAGMPGGKEKENPEVEIKEEISSMPEKERKKMAVGLRNLGFYVEEYKDKFFAKTAEEAAVLVSDKSKNIAEQGTFARFLVSLGENFRQDAEKSRMSINKINEGETKTMANAGYLFGNILKYGRIAADFTKWTVASPLRYWMMGAMAFSRSFDAMEEARLKNKDVMNKTRIEDENRAAEEAWKIYEQARGDREIASKEDLEKFYQRNIPEDLLRRLNQNPSEASSGNIFQNMSRHRILKVTGKINRKIEEVEKDSKLNAAEKEILKEQIIGKYKEYLKSFDRIVSECGTVDALAVGARYAGKLSKVAVYAVTAETLALAAQKIIENAPQILGDIEKLTSVSTVGVAEAPENGAGFLPGGRGAELTVEQGSNLEGTLIKNGINGHDAHIMANEYAEKLGVKEVNLIHPGAQIELTPDGQHIADITGDKNMGYLNPESAGAMENPEVFGEANDAPAGDFYMDDAATKNMQNLETQIQGVSDELAQLDRQIPEVESNLGGVNTYTTAAEEAAKQKDYLHQLIDRKQVLEKTQEELFLKRDISQITSIRKYIAGGSAEKWASIENSPAKELLSDKKTVAGKFYEHIMKSGSPEMEKLKEHIKPKEGESISKWITGVVKAAKKLGIKKL